MPRRFMNCSAIPTTAPSRPPMQPLTNNHPPSKKTIEGNTPNEAPAIMAQTTGSNFGGRRNFSIPRSYRGGLQDGSGMRRVS